MYPEPLIFKLSNGIRAMHQPMEREVAHCGIMIGAGSRHELKHEHGLAHFLEHALFKGTSKRKTHHILSRLDAVGGELNAFTAKEETWVHASFLKADFERAIELITDIAFNATFPAHEIEKEKEVILDEINSYKDSPSDMIFEEFDEILFTGHGMGRSILGSEKSLSTFNTNHLLRFRTRNFTAPRIVFSSAGNIQPDKLMKMLETHLGSMKLSKRSANNEPLPPYKPKHITQKKDIHQVHYLMGLPAFDFNDERRPAFSLLNNILGGPAMNNRLSMNIREKHGIAYQVDSNYAPYSDTGIFSIYLGTEKKNLDKSISLIWKELNQLRNYKLSTRQLSDAKKQMIGQIGLAQDSGSALMFNLGKSLALFNRIDTLEELFQKIDDISAQQMQEVANEIFDEKRMSSLTYTY
ncbi:MAG: M16 family metallopeptidase [Flavobacteriales bacterium]